MKFLARLRAIAAFVFNRPLKVRLHHRDAWLFPAESRVLPVIAGAGADGAGDGGGDGTGDGGGSGDGAGTGSGSGDGSGEGADAGEGEGGDGGKSGPDFKAESRKHEREKKKARKERDELAVKLKTREDADKSEQEKAVEKAREEGKTEALTEAEKERRKDRLESAIIRAAGKKIKLGEGDKALETRFEDPEDAEIYLQRKITKGDLDEDDLFDGDGKVKASVVADALREILEEKPRLAEDGKAPAPKTANGGVDGGAGDGDAGDGPDDMNQLLRRKR
ncbi:MAG TPA: hypothetical protein VEW07_06330 [Solirubrobacterales bacterium]|nr:hypothetical protein [Solirubrobacterales bacterium]